MGLSKSNKLRCLVRQRAVAATPEEFVRQKLLAQMIGPLGYPRGQLAVEKNLFAAGMLRRIDIVCFTPWTDTLRPLLLVECKAADLTLEAERQLFGYNAQIGAPFLCLAGSTQVRLLWQEQGEVRSVPFLPSYGQLVNQAGT